MSDTGSVCAACQRPSPDATLCRPCTHTLEQALGDIAALVTELATTLTRQARIGGGDGGRRSAERPLPYHAAASEAATVLDNTLTAWVQAIAVEGDWLDNTTTAKAAWLLSHIETLRQHPDAADAADEIQAAVRTAVTVIDRPADRILAGACGANLDDGACREMLMVRPNAAAVTCRACHTVWNVEQRRTWLIAALDDTLATATEILRGLPSIAGITINANTLRSWRAREQLVPHGVDVQGRELFRVGDVLDLAQTAATRATTRRHA